MKRRAVWHDYRTRCIYMVTLSRYPECKLWFSQVKGDATRHCPPLAPYVELTETGQVIRRQLGRIKECFPQVQSLRSVVMPDHVHALIFVRQDMREHLGTVMAWWKQGVDRECGAKVFEEGYHDRIVKGRDQGWRLGRYIDDNPMRWLVRRSMPGFFTRRHILTSGGRHWCAYGDITLLRNPLIEALRVSRRHTDAERRQKAELWYETARQGGVVVSPFIHPEERRLRRDLVELGARIVHLRAEGFAPKWKPSGCDFDLCTQGRLLVIAPVDSTGRKVTMSRSTAEELNFLATELAEKGYSDWVRKGDLPATEA